MARVIPKFLLALATGIAACVSPPGPGQGKGAAPVVGLPALSPHVVVLLTGPDAPGDLEVVAFRPQSLAGGPGWIPSFATILVTGPEQRSGEIRWPADSSANTTEFKRLKPGAYTLEAEVYLEPIGGNQERSTTVSATATASVCCNQTTSVAVRYLPPPIAREVGGMLVSLEQLEQQYLDPDPTASPPAPSPSPTSGATVNLEIS